MIRASLALLLITGFQGLVPAQQSSDLRRDGRYWVQEETASIAAGSRLRVSSVGRVSVSGSNTREISYTVTKRVRAANEAEARQRLEPTRVSLARQGGGSIVVSLRNAACKRCSFSADLEIRVPTATRQITVVTEGGDIEGQAIEGELNAETTGGGIKLNAIGGSVAALTAGGDIALGAIGGEVRCETAGGNIILGQSRGNASLNTSGGSIKAGRVGGVLQAETLGGSIEVEDAAGGVFVGTNGGTIRLGRVLGAVSASTAGGSILVAEAPQGIHAETSAGDIRLEQVSGEVFAASAAGNVRAVFVTGAELQDSLLETTGGSIVVYLPANLGVTIDASVDLAKSLNRILSEFSAVTVQRSGGEFGPAAVTASGEINGGGPVLRIRNTDGRIEIRKQQ